MLSDVFANAKNLKADIYLEDIEQTYVCTIISKLQALEFEKKLDRPHRYKVVFRDFDDNILCTQRYRKMDDIVEQLNKSES